MEDVHWLLKNYMEGVLWVLSNYMEGVHWLLNNYMLPTYIVIEKKTGDNFSKISFMLRKQGALGDKSNGKK